MVRNLDFDGSEAIWRSEAPNRGERSEAMTHMHQIVHGCKSGAKLNERNPKGIRRAIHTHMVCTVWLVWGAHPDRLALEIFTPASERSEPD